LTRTVVDAAVLLQAIAGYDAREATSVDRPVPTFAEAFKRAPSSLRVGMPRDYFFAALHPDVEAAVGQALAVLSRLTAGVQEVVVPVSPNVNATVMPAEAFAFHAARVREAPQRFQPAVLGRLREGAAIDTPTYIDRRRALDQMRQAASGLFAHVDVLVAPTVPVLPVPIAEARDDEASVALYARNTRPFNAYGLPAISVPCGFAKNGLPIGLQIVGPPWGEEAVLRLAHAYEQATDWKTRRPVL
jgi:aspartyl-tRNA(Asn)/glutamyl-tRNA(Gln) amidotransferase subunit A